MAESGHRSAFRHPVVDVFASAHLWRSPWVLLAVHLALGVLLFAAHRSLDTVALYVVGFVLGPLAEIYAARQGAWFYSDGGAQIAGVPVWLPFAWGVAAILFRNLEEGLVGLIGRGATGR